MCRGRFGGALYHVVVFRSCLVSLKISGWLAIVQLTMCTCIYSASQAVRNAWFSLASSEGQEVPHAATPWSNTKQNTQGWVVPC